MPRHGADRSGKQDPNPALAFGELQLARLKHIACQKPAWNGAQDGVEGVVALHHEDGCVVVDQKLFANGVDELLPELGGVDGARLCSRSAEGRGLQGARRVDFNGRKAFQGPGPPRERDRLAECFFSRARNARADVRRARDAVGADVEGSLLPRCAATTSSVLRRNKVLVACGSSAPARWLCNASAIGAGQPRGASTASESSGL